MNECAQGGLGVLKLGACEPGTGFAAYNMQAVIVLVEELVGATR